MAAQLKAALICATYRKALLASREDAGGHIQTLVSIDAGRVVNLCISFHELWSLPLQIAIALYLLYLQVALPILDAVCFSCGFLSGGTVTNTGKGIYFINSWF